MSGRILFLLIVVVFLGSGIFFISRSVSRSNARNEAIDLVDKKKYLEAIPRLRALNEQEPDDVEVLQNLVTSLLAQNTPKSELFPLLTHWCELRPDNPEPFMLRLDAYLTASRNEEALGDAQRVLELRPDEHTARWMEVQVLRNLGRFEEAKRDCQILLDAKARPAHELKTMLAQILIQNNELESAARVLDGLLAERSDLESAMMYRGVVHFKQGQFPEAIELLSKLDRSPTPMIRDSAYYHRALALDKLGRKQESKQVFEALAKSQRAVLYSQDAELMPDDWSAQLRAAKALFEAGYDDYAVKTIESAITRIGENPGGLNLLAEFYEGRGIKDLAERYRRRAKSQP